MPATVKLDFRLPYRVEREGEQFVATCHSLDVSSFGDTHEEAGRMLGEAVELFLEGCLEMGTLEQVLRDCGFSQSGESEPAPDEADGIEYLNVPLNLLAAEHLNGKAAQR